MASPWPRDGKEGKFSNANLFPEMTVAEKEEEAEIGLSTNSVCWKINNISAENEPYRGILLYCCRIRQRSSTHD
jgi:hypothetical protein